MGVISQLTFWQEVVLTFKEIGWLPAILIVAGLVLVVVEMYKPSKGILGVVGSVLVVIGFAVRMHKHGVGNQYIQLVAMASVVVVVLLIALVVLVICLKKGWISREISGEKSKSKMTVREQEPQSVEDITAVDTSSDGESVEK